MPSGATGSPRPGGQAQNDAFTNREKASEDMYIHQREMEMKAAMKAKKAQAQGGEKGGVKGGEKG